MVLPILFVLLSTGVAGQRAGMPGCNPQPDRKVERIRGVVKRGGRFVQTTAAGWIVRLVPGPRGWFLEVTMKGRETEDLSRLTPPWHFVPNPREIEGWHFRNADNTGPNDGSVNAWQELREFIFSPEVGRGIEYNGSGTMPEDVEKVRAFGRGWLFIESYELTPPRRGEQAAFETISFTACLTWPADSALEQNTFSAVQLKDLARLSCPCEFYQSMPNEREGSYGSGPRVLVIAPNETNPFALVNLGEDDIKLAPIGQRGYECEKGKIYSPSWKHETVTVSAHLSPVEPGAEACWFEGTLTLKRETTVDTVRIKGGCGC